MERRRFIQTAIAGSIGETALVPRRSAAMLDPKALADAPWKLDVVVYDRRGWTSTTYGLPVIKRGKNQLIIGFQAQGENGITDDFYSAHAEWVFLSSENGGRSWQRIPLDAMGLDPGWPDRSAHCTNAWPVRLSDGTLINVVEEVPTRQQQKERLEKLGLGYLWHPDSTFGWDLWPASSANELREKGLTVFDTPGPWIPPGVVATHNRPLVATISSDGGRTWQTRPVEGLPPFSRVSAWFRRAVALADGTVLGAIYGQIRAGDKARQWFQDSSYALRSSDRGKSWQLVPIAHDPTGELHFNETDLLALPGGRVLAMVRGGKKAQLFSSFSDDSGRTWSPPKPTPIPGSPANLLRLKSGNILCVYRYAGYPEGYRGVLSRDDGKTWDVANEKLLRDDTLPGLVGYPSSVQLEDGTIFTLYNVLRVGKLKPEDNWKYKEDLLVRPPLHSYIAASIYTENYAHPLG